MSELLSSPVLFVVLLSIVLLALPCAYLYMMVRERRPLDRLRRRLS